MKGAGIMKPFVELAIERWAEEYNEEFDQRDANRRRLFTETIHAWLEKQTREGFRSRQALMDGRSVLNNTRYPLSASEYDLDLLWIPHSYNPDGTFDFHINYAVAVEILGRKHTSKTKKEVSRLVKIQESRSMAGLSCLCGQSHDILVNQALDQIVINHLEDVAEPSNEVKEPE